MNCAGESKKTVYRGDASLLHFIFLDAAVNLTSSIINSSSLNHPFCKFLYMLQIAF